MVPTLHMSKTKSSRDMVSQAVRRVASPVVFVLSLSLSTTFLSADIPRKAPLTRYTGLWTNSPFTSKPPPPESAPAINPLDDFTLTGIAPIPGGYRITIISKKDPNLKEVIEPGGNSDYKFVSVNRNPDKALGTTVVLSAGNVQGTVGFEREMLTLKAPPVEQQEAQPANLPPGADVSGKAGTPQRQPRPRIVPPPQPAANQKAQSNDSNRARQRRR